MNLGKSQSEWIQGKPSDLRYMLKVSRGKRCIRRQRDSGVAKGAGIPEKRGKCRFRPLPSVLTHQTHLPTGRPRPSSQNTPSPPGFHSVFLLNKLRVRWMHILLKKLFNSAFFLDCGKALGQNNEKEMINNLNLCFWNSNSKYLST